METIKAFLMLFLNKIGFAFAFHKLSNYICVKNVKYAKYAIAKRNKLNTILCKLLFTQIQHCDHLIRWSVPNNAVQK